MQCCSPFYPLPFLLVPLFSEDEWCPIKLKLFQGAVQKVILLQMIIFKHSFFYGMHHERLFSFPIEPRNASSHPVSGSSLRMFWVILPRIRCPSDTCILQV